ncbi:fumarylacetoacetate hydrolase family protein [Eoetvoesiella caeni]|uniref:2-keto-4-pentenoate hydratase/2-oxohepta-3-ene-1,7-dioic acid hydratase in catechol pathway n=1 Tax=Eoetvoesiella caeni TaxID=645616 RepID=A0A366GYD1_9BURK|nr:fumarylacetoacetate hydrolase family protein [Eoetvoesiella caeni]MCI2811260.1 fumarylacetoacetate hydrolase family protein [Eoetvoesiella caeni]NYT57131.1 fumarylacetoacetate hydrolase family protein [Eoetvoesiella caeni]RBP33641.1 2-keto-4-pentenoate hydratase/2-oxohepta-3-ene-1,7-dioic acid hydratase in catechol pathway [Eoetvoesiella caeni]
MRLCRFNQDRLGVVKGSNVFDVTAALDVLPGSRYPLPTYDLLIANLDKVRARIEEILPSATSLALADVQLLSPVANPGKLVAAPVNYLKHLEEARADPGVHHNNQVDEIQRIGLFLKATSSLIGPSQGVVINHPDRRNDHEIELAVVIGKPGKHISAANAWDHIAGYSIGLDMTVRGPEERSMRKSIDTYSVLGPWLVTADEIADATNLDFHLTVNGETRQKANTKDLVIGIAQLIEFASAFYTLHPGDVIYTGTPEGVGPVQAGDTIMAEFDQIGRMEVAVRAI